MLTETKSAHVQVKMGYNRVTGEKVAVKIITKNENHKGFNTKRIFQEINVQKVCLCRNGVLRRLVNSPRCVTHN